MLSGVYLFALVVVGLLFQLLGQSSSLWRASETGSFELRWQCAETGTFCPAKANIWMAQSAKLNYLQCSQAERTGLNTSTFFPVEGNQRDGSPPCCASGGKELSGPGGLPLSEQVRTLHEQPLRCSPCSEGWHSSPSGCFTSQQLSGEENSGRKHGASLQRPSPQARVSQTPAQSQGSPAHRWHL